MAANMQELTEEEQKVVRPLAYFLRQRMEAETHSGRWMKLKERLGCWGRLTRTVHDDEDDEDDEDDVRTSQGMNLNETTPLQGRSDPSWVSLAMALAAERELRAVQQPLLRVSLMRLMEEAEGGEVEEGVAGCCVCMAKRKGAAFIPCGHTFCRACAREMWVGRGTCPLCNGRILEILHIY